MEAIVAGTLARFQAFVKRDDENLEDTAPNAGKVCTVKESPHRGLAQVI
jgi:hypothetical protein